MTVLSKPDFGPSAAAYEAGRLDYLAEQVARVADILGKKQNPVYLDIGAGTGKLSRVVAAHAGKLYCVEPDPKMYAECVKNMERFGNTEVREGTAQATGLADRSVDFIVMGDAAHWLQPAEDVLKEFRRILKEDGKIAVFVRYPDTRSPALAELHRLLEEHCHTYSLPDANKLSDAGGLLDKKKGDHLLVSERRTIVSHTVPENFTKESLLKYLQSRSSTNRWSLEHPNDAMEHVIEPLFAKYAKDGVVTIPRVFHVMIGDVKELQKSVELPRLSIANVR